MKNIRTLWREPLIHFLMIGAGLFLLFEMTQPPRGDTPERIVVSASQVEQLNAQFNRTWLRPPAETELTGLIDNFVRDEVYYREALALGLDRDDPFVRRRMRQKLEFLLEDLSVENDPSDPVLADYLQQYPDRFRSEPRISFRQIYLSPDKGRDLEADAKKVLTRLHAGVDPGTLGDPTLVAEFFDMAPQSMIARSFGNVFAQEVVTLIPGDWSGPFYSGLGAHLVLVMEKKKARLPELAEVRAQVEREYLAQRRREQKDITYQKLLQRYEVVVETTMPGSTAGKAMAVTKSDETEP